jgi:hypothetical protein
LRPLLPFFNLTCVEVTSAFGFDLDDSTVLEMARAWPRLEELTLLCLEAPSNVGPTLASLRSFAQYCPVLETLHTTVDGTVAPSDDELSTHIFQECLSFLDVANSRIDSPMDVAKFLSGVFPNLNNIITNLEYRSHYGLAAGELTTHNRDITSGPTGDTSAGTAMGQHGRDGCFVAFGVLSHF